MFELVPYRLGKVGGANRPFRYLAHRLTLGFLPYVLLVLSVGRAWAVDVPFSAAQTIDGDFDSANSVRAADMDGDGDLDVLGAAGFADDITWWENLNGTGTSWTEHTIVGTFDGAGPVRAADLDGDGDLDVLGAATLGDDIAWWENLDGAGTSWAFARLIDFDFDGAQSVCAADVDGDGDLDVLGAAGPANDVTWWENVNGAGTSWTEHTIDGDFVSASSVHAADVDGDGDLDVLGTATLVHDITWWENLNGAGTSWAEHTIDGDFGGAHSVHTADIDRDGDLDVLGAALFDDDITWWENLNGAGTSWTEHTIDGAFERAYSVYASDLDGDGDTDVLGTADTVGAAATADDIKWWENLNGAGTSWTAHTIDNAFDGAASAHAADVDGDGDLDVLGAGFVVDDIAWWENQTIHRNGVLPTEHTIDGAFDGALSVDAADMDGDGDLDVLGAAIEADEIRWWENLSGAGTSWTVHTIDGAFFDARSVHAADVDGDGDIDVLGAASFAADIAWWENLNGAGTSWAEHTIDGAFFDARSVHAADVDGDGDIDVLGAASFAADIAWWENLNGAGTSWAEHTIDGAFFGAHSVHAADVDGDGDIDVLGAAALADDIVWWENLTGAGTSWTKHTIDGAFSFAVSVHAADVDGDGDLDVLGAAATAFDITWWENLTGAGTSWTAHTIDGAFNAARSVHAADVDGDGDLDVLGAAPLVHDITWWENLTGAGTSWTTHTIDGAFDHAYSVHAADVDSDGDVDVLGAAFLADDIAWWENRGGQFALPTTSLAASPLTLPIEPAVLQIDAVHNGRTGDTDVELVTFELLFDDPTTPLTTNQANEAIENLRIYRDDGSGVFEPADDFLVASVSSLSLSAGVQQVSFADGNPDVQVVFGTGQRYFVVLDLVSAGLVNMLRVTHLTESSSSGEDRDHDIPLKLEFSLNTPTSTMLLEAGPEADCPPDLVRANQTLAGTQTLKATSTATLGPNLIVDGTDISVNAPLVSILAGTAISGIFSIGTNPACP